MDSLPPVGIEMARTFSLPVGLTMKVWPWRWLTSDVCEVQGAIFIGDELRMYCGHAHVCVWPPKSPDDLVRAKWMSRYIDSLEQLNGLPGLQYT